MTKYYLYNSDNNVMDRKGQVMDREEADENRDKVKLFDTREEATGAIWATRKALDRQWFVGEIEVKQGITPTIYNLINEVVADKEENDTIETLTVKVLRGIIERGLNEQMPHTLYIEAEIEKHINSVSTHSIS